MSALARFESSLRSYRLTFPKGRDVEYRALPPMVDVYRGMTRPSGLPPTQEMFARRVVMDAERMDPGAVPADGIYARACRTYPSLVRQHHFSVALEGTRLDAVHWIPWLDYQGVDLLVLHRSFAVGVALSVDTELGGFWQRVKTLRHPEVVGLRMLYFDVEPRAYQVGDFWLHSPADVSRVVTAMRELIIGERTQGLPTLAEAEAMVAAMKVRGDLRTKVGFNADLRAVLAEYRALALRRAWGNDDRQLDLPLEHPA